MQSTVVGLFGGGQDSFVARELLARAGVPVHWVHLDTGFVHPARRRAVRELPTPRRARSEVEPVDVFDAFVREVLIPDVGDPCLAGRAFLLRCADRLARERGIHVLATADVVGQRAHDQSRAALQRADRDAGVRGRVYRPLSAGLLGSLSGADARPFTIPQRLHGRGRRVQVELARRFGLVGLPAPSDTCCQLARPRFAARLRDWWEHEDRVRFNREVVARLGCGRHFRLAWNLKVIVGRNERECAWLARHTTREWSAQVDDGRGAVVLVEGQLQGRQADIAAIAARFAGAGRTTTTVVLRRGPEAHRLETAPISRRRLADWRI